MAGMEGRLQAHLNRQVWKILGVIVPVIVVSMGMTGYFVKILA